MPVEFHMTDETRDQDHVDRTVAEHLVGEVHAVVNGVFGFRNIHQNAAYTNKTPSGMISHPTMVRIIA
jgi:hypothetical protein